MAYAAAGCDWNVIFANQDLLSCIVHTMQHDVASICRLAAVCKGTRRALLQAPLSALHFCMDSTDANHQISRLRTIARLPKLQHLRLHGLDVNVVPCIAMLLQPLTACTLMITNKSRDTSPAVSNTMPLSALGHIMTLRRLELMFLHPTYLVGLPGLTGLRHLEALTLEGRYLLRRYDGLETLEQLRTLELLRKTGRGSDPAALHVSNLTNLEKLAMLEVTHIPSLLALTALTRLELSGRLKSDDVLHLPSSLLHLALEADELPQLGGPVNVRELVLGVDDATDISSWAPLAPNITSITMHWEHTMTDLSPFADLRNLERLHLRFMGMLTDLSEATRLTRLTELDVR